MYLFATPERDLGLQDLLKLRTMSRLSTSETMHVQMCSALAGHYRQHVRFIKTTKLFVHTPPQAPHDKAHVKVKVLDGVGADVREHYNFGPDRQGKIIGKGQFGTVRQATSIKTGEQVAVKSIAKRKLLTDEEVEDVRRCVNVQRVSLEAVQRSPMLMGDSYPTSLPPCLSCFLVLDVCTKQLAGQLLLGSRNIAPPGGPSCTRPDPRGI
eukprot:732808-Pelagomonas_calceolata.AAC.4